MVPHTIYSFYGQCENNEDIITTRYSNNNDFKKPF